MNAKVIVTSIVGLVIVVALLSGAVRPEGNNPKAWEYKVVSFHGDGSDEHDTKKLNELATEGWEYMATIGGGKTSGIVAFKRPKK